jgi:hypothetical protein
MLLVSVSQTEQQSRCQPGPAGVHRRKSLKMRLFTAKINQQLQTISQWDLDNWI